MSWRRILLLTSALLAALLGMTWFVLQRTGAVTALVRSFLEQTLATGFRLEHAQADLFGGNLALEHLGVTDPARPGSELFAAEWLQLGVETDPLGNVLGIHELIVDGLLLDLDLTGDRAPSLPRLLRATGGESAPVDTVTPARIGRGRVRVRVDEQLPTLEFSAVELTLQRVRGDDGGADRQRGVLTGRAHCDNLAIDVELLGEIDLAAQRLRVEARLGAVRVDTEFLRRLMPLLRTELRDDIASGTLQAMTLQIELPLSAGQEAVATAAFEFTAISCMLPELPVPLRSANVSGTISTRDGGTARFTGERLLPTGETKVIAKIGGFFDQPRLEVRGQGRGVVIDDIVRRALGSFAAGRAVVEGLQPTAGLADFDLFLGAIGTEDEVVDLDLQLRGVALAYHGFGTAATRAAFPVPIVQAQGRVHLRDDAVSIEDVTAELAPEAGGGSVTMSGHVDPSGPAHDRVRIELQARQVQFTPALRQAFATLVRDDGALYDQFAPTGTAAVKLSVLPDATGESTWQVEVSPLGASGRWHGFPLPLHDIHGKIVARAEGLQVQLDAAYGQARATLRGAMLAPPDRPGALAEGNLDLRIVTADVPLDDELHMASVRLAPKLETVWADLQPRGRAGAELHIRRSEAAAPLVWDLALELLQVQALPRSFPLPVTAAYGTVYVRGRDGDLEVQVDAIRGMLQDDGTRAAEFAIVGTIRTDADGYAEHLTAVVRDLELDAQLGTTLEQTGAVGPGTWDVLRPSGRVDLVCRQETESERHLRDYTVLLRGVRCGAAMLPMPAEQVTGELRVRDGELTFTDLRAKLADSLVTCSSGRVGPIDGGRTEVAFAVSAERFPLDDRMANLFVGPMQQAVKDRQLQGQANITGLRLRFLLPRDGSDEPIETVLQGQIEALDVELVLGTRLQQVNGVILIDESRVTRNGGRITGNLTKGSLRLFGHPCVDAQAEFAADAEQFVLHRLSLGLHAGRVQSKTAGNPSLVYRLAHTESERGRLSADLQWSGVSLSEFLQYCGQPGSPYHGTLEGWLELDRLDGYDFVGMAGRGSLRVLDGNLGHVPLFTAIYALMAERNRPRFDSLVADFEVGERQMTMQNLSLRSPLITLQGEGTMSMEGYLDVRLTTDSFLGSSADMFLLPPVIQMITSNLVRFHLHGHLRDLRAEQRWFAQRDPRRQRLLPAPPVRQKTQRPDF